MSKLKAWHILVPTLILTIAAPVGIFFGVVKKDKEAVEAVDAEIATHQEKARQIEIKKVDLQEAKFATAHIAKELTSVKSAKLPMGSTNPWWNALRGGNTLVPGPATIPLGERGELVSVPDAAMLDMWFLLREDLGLMLKDFFESTGCEVSSFTLPDPRMEPYSETDLAMTIPLSNLTVRGSYENVLRFLRRLGEAPLLMTVQGPVTLTAVPATEGREVTANLTIIVQLFPNVSPDRMSDLAGMLAAAGSAAAATGGGGMGPMAMGGPSAMGGGPTMMGASAPAGGSGGGATAAPPH